MKKQPKKKQPDGFLRYSGMAFTMAAAIGLFTYGGMRLDQYTDSDKPVWTAVGALFGVAVAIYYVIKDFQRG